MQEIKCKAEQFPFEQFEEAGYHVEAHGFSQWNGVAIASREPLTDVSTCLSRHAGLREGPRGRSTPRRRPARSVRRSAASGCGACTCPTAARSATRTTTTSSNGSARCSSTPTDALAGDPDLALALVGDFNIAPTDADNGDPAVVPGFSTHVSPPEREAFAALESAGLTDVVRPLVPTGFTYWDYKRLRFPKNEGMRIDFILGSHAFSNAVTGATIHRNERKGEAPSDHVPVVVDLDLTSPEEEDDDRPMIFG